MSPEKPLRIDLPVNVPPHNCIHVSGRTKRLMRVTNAEALGARAAFRQEVALRLPRRLKRRLEGPLAVRFSIWRRARTEADGDNLQKELFDALTDAGVWIDDRQIKHWQGTVVAQGPRVTPRVLVEITPYEGSPA